MFLTFLQRHPLQVLTAWDTLEQHAEAWVQSLPEAHACLGEGVVQTLRERAAKHYHPAFEAAYYLDQIGRASCRERVFPVV